MFLFQTLLNLKFQIGTSSYAFYDLKILLKSTILLSILIVFYFVNNVLPNLKSQIGTSSFEDGLHNS